MTWPTFNLPGASIVHPSAIPPEWQPVVRHDARQRGTQPGAPGVHAVAVDVWREGVHLWRSWAPETGESVDTWAARTLGADAPTNHDDGHWRAPGVHGIADWPVPTAASCTPGLSIQAVYDLLYTLPVIVLMNPPPGLADKVPAPMALTMRLSRANLGAIVVAFEVDGVSVRAMITRAAALHIGETPEPVRWQATLARRPTRAGALDADLPESTVVVLAPERAPESTVLRMAKAALGIPGWPAQQRDKSRPEWFLARAPYLLTLERLTG